MNRITQLHYSQLNDTPTITALTQDGQEHLALREHKGDWIFVTADDKIIVLSNREYEVLTDSGFYDIR